MNVLSHSKQGAMTSIAAADDSTERISRFGFGLGMYHRSTANSGAGAIDPIAGR